MSRDYLLKVAVSKEELDAIREYAEKDDRSMASLLRIAVMQHIKRYPKK